MGFSSSDRPLPKPPVSVNSSRSLDRGFPPTATAEGLKRTRKQPSVVSEEGSEDGLAHEMERMKVGVPSIGTTSTTTPSAPATFTPLPVLNFPDSESSAASSDDENIESTPRAKGRQARQPISPPKRAPSPGIAFSGLPVISVSSEEPTGEISIVVPSFSLDPPSASTSTTSPIPASPIPAPPSASSASAPTRVEPNGSAILCAGCGQPIIGRIVSAMKQRWHPGCFSCAECGELLEHVSSYEWEGKAYCHLDYHDKFAYRCHHCKTPIVDHRFVTLEDPVLGQRYYHELHFFCSECGDPFLDPSKSSAPGTERARRPESSEDQGSEDEGETNAFVIHKGHPYCEHCHLRLHKPKCKACSLPIPDIAINAMGAKWHKECFVCSSCGDEFANNLFFPKDGKALCTLCYEQVISS
ncbi:hypothetical protein P7C73_g78, partial [Tremellales sp. Uapishka_1]